MARFFISYARPDLAWAQRIDGYLKKAGHTAVFQDRDFRPGGHFLSEISEAIDSADRVIAILSPNYLGSDWTRVEWEAAFHNDILLPVRVHEAGHASLLSQISYIDLVGLDEPAARDRLLREVTRALERPVRPLGQRHPVTSPIPAEIDAAYRTTVISSLHLARFAFWISTNHKEALSTESLERLYIELDTTREITVEDEGARAPDSRPNLRKMKRKQTALEAAMANNRALFLGGPGSGKSTFLNHLAYCLAGRKREAFTFLSPDQPTPLPIYLKLGDVADWASEGRVGGTNLLWEYLTSWLQQSKLEYAADFLSQAINNGQAIVFLDGLDEIPRGEPRKLIRNSIEHFGDNYPGNRLLATCRTLAYREDPDARLLGWAEYELNSLEDRQIDAFLEAWQTNVSAILEHSTEQSVSLAELFQRTDIRSLARDPLLLTLIALVHTFYGQPSTSAAPIFDGAIELLLWRWEKGKSGKGFNKPQLQALLRQANVSREEFRACLDRLAFEAHIEASLGKEADSAGTIRETLAVEELRELHPERNLEWVREVLDALRLRTGLMQRTVGEYLRFSHLSFQELMAGTYLARKQNFGKTASDLLAKTLRFREMALLAVNSLVHQREEYERPLALVDALCPPGPTVVWPRVWIAGEVLLEVGLDKVERVPMGPWVLERVRKRLNDLLDVGALSPPERARAGDVLGQLGDPRFDPLRFHLPTLFRGMPEDLLGFVKIPLGPFAMGSRDGDQDSDLWELGNPETLNIPYDYWIGRYPVTVAQYRAFVDDGGYEAPTWWSTAGWRWRQITDEMEYPAGTPDAWLWEFRDLRSSRARPDGWEQKARFPNRPVTGICWFEAMAYATWLNQQIRKQQRIPEGYVVRLPTEDEWEKAARWSDFRNYPWGDADWTAERSNTKRSGIRNPTPVGMYPQGASGLNLLDLSGNVKEWLLSSFQLYPYLPRDGRNAIGEVSARDRHVLRGGSYQLEISQSRCAARSYDYLHSFSSDCGFRLVLSVPPDALSTEPPPAALQDLPPR